MSTVLLDDLFPLVNALAQGESISEEKIKWLHSIEVVKQERFNYLVYRWDNLLVEKLTSVCPNIQHLDLSFTNFTDISILLRLKNLSVLSLNRSLISSIKSPVRRARMIRVASDSDTPPVIDISSLCTLSHLTDLSLGGLFIADFSPLAKLSHLKRLSLDETNIIDLSPLQGLSQLSYLSLLHTKVTDFSPLSKTSQLTKLAVDCANGADLSVLGKLSHLTSLQLYRAHSSPIIPSNSEDILNPIDISFLRSLTQLTNFSILSLPVFDYSPLADLTHLTSLNIIGCNCTDTSFMEKLTNLSELHLEMNPVSNINGLVNLTKLKTLNLHQTNIVDISPLSTLIQLTHLYLYNTKVEDIYPIIGLKNLEILDLDYTLVSDLSPLANLASLSSISLASTSISDISPLASLKKLKEIVINDTFVRDLSPVSNLFQLHILLCENTPIGDIYPLANLSMLESLVLDDNHYIMDFSPLAKLEHLKYLSLDNTDIKDLSPLANLTLLDRLSLDNTPVSDLSPLKNLSNLSELSLNDTLVEDINDIKNLTLQSLCMDRLHLNEIPHEIVKNTKNLSIDNSTIIKQPLALFDLPREQVLSLYYDQIRQPVREGKVIFLGDSGVGKTHTIQRILKQGEDSPIETESTQGVKIYPYSDTGSNKTINFWDFGGQDIQRSMHKCFLTERTCYVVVVSNRDPEKSMPEAVKWLRTISNFSKQVSVLLLVNQWTEVPPQRRIDETLLRRQFPLLTDIIYFSAKGDTQDKFQNVINAINNEVDKLDSIQLELPASWAAIRKELLESQENYISMKKYEEICASHGLGGSKDAMVSIRQWLLRWFNDLGICFSYHENIDDLKDRLMDYKVLKPDWLTNGIYRLILMGRHFSAGGSISRENIEEVLSNADYRVNGVNTDYNSKEAGYILEVMRKLGRSYQESEDMEFIPDLLDAKQPEDAEPKDYKNVFAYSCLFSWFPRILLHRLMIALRRWGDGIRWLTGFRLREKNIVLLITGDEETGIINIKMYFDNPSEFFLPFHNARLLLLQYAEEMGLEIIDEHIGRVSEGSTIGGKLFDLIWAYLDDKNGTVNVSSVRGSRPRKIAVSDILMPFFNDEICTIAEHICEENNLSSALNAVTTVFPYYTSETIEAIKNYNMDEFNLFMHSLNKNDHTLTEFERLAKYAQKNSKILNWLQKNGTLIDELNPMSNNDTEVDIDENLHKTNLQGINKQLYCWAKKSPLYQKAVITLDLDSLAKALGPNETERYQATFDLVSTIWKTHPELGLMPDYSFLSKREHDGAFYPGYRDHVTHMFKVYLLGMYLFEKEISIQEKFTNGDFFTVWTLCALWHDIGYLIETEEGARDSKNAEEAFSRFNDILSLPLTNLFHDSAFQAQEKALQNGKNINPRKIITLVNCEEKLSEFEHFGETVNLAISPVGNPIKEYYEQMAKKRDDYTFYDHGIISASLLLFMRDSICEYFERTKAFNMIEQRTSRRDEFLNNAEVYRNNTFKAAVAISLHNISEPKNDNCKTELNQNGVTISDFCINIDIEPYSWLLRVCDEVQCWDRQRFSNPIDDKARKMKPFINGADLEFDNTFNLTFKDNKEEREKIKNALSHVITPMPSFLK